MAATFRIAAVERPVVRDVLERVTSAIADVECAGKVPPDMWPSSGWPESVVKLFRPGISTRVVEATRVDDGFEVTVHDGATAEDYAIGVEAANAIAEATGATERFEAVADAAAKETAGLCAVLAAAAGGETVVMPGPQRDFHLGPRTLAALAAGGSDDELPARLLAALRKAQYVPAHYHRAARLTMYKGDEDIDLAIWPEDLALLFSPVGYIAVAPAIPKTKQRLSREERPIWVPYAALPDISPTAGFVWLDEVHCTVEATAGAPWLAVIAAARAREVFPLKPPKGPKTWWQFWR